jgi:hypothetical protein
MLRGFAMLVSAGMLLALTAVPGSAKDASDTPDGTIELHGGSVAAGVGFTWESGSLIFHGKKYPVSVTGIDVADVGATKVSATGKIYNLKKLEDFDGTFASLGAGAALGGGVDTASMKNQNGVQVDLNSTTEGAKLTFAAGGVSMKVDKHPTSTSSATDYK